MKKVLIMHPQLVVGGVDRVLLNMLSSLNKDDFDITLLLRNRSVWDNKIPSNIHVKYMFKKNPLEMGGLIARLYKYSMIFFPKVVMRMYGTRDKYDVSIAFHEPMLWFLDGLKGKRVSWVHSDYGPRKYCPEVKQLRNKTGILAHTISKKRNKIITSLDKVVFVSESIVQNYVEKTGLPHDKAVVLYNINDEKLIIRKSTEAIEDTVWKDFDGIHLCAVGRISEEKAFYRLIYLMDRLKKSSMYAKIYIIGDGPEKDNLQKIIDANGMQEDIIIMGFRDNPYKYIADSKLLLCTSIYEAYCTVTKESILLGVPFITTDCAGMKEQIGDSKSGIIVENTDESICNAVVQVLRDKVKYAEMKRSCVLRRVELSDAVSISKIQNLLMEL